MRRESARTTRTLVAASAIAMLLAALPATGRADDSQLERRRGEATPGTTRAALNAQAPTSGNDIVPIGDPLPAPGPRDPQQDAPLSVASGDDGGFLLRLRELALAARTLLE
jgi:hypothetical protein